MSADSVEDCPICTKELYDKIHKIELEIEDAFTTMIANEYEKFKRKKLKEIEDIEEDISENYQIGIYGTSHVFFDEDNRLCIKVGAECEKCGTKWETNIRINAMKVK
jgi:glucose/arabinose dehydrogenase